MEAAFAQKRSEKRLKINFPLEVNLKTAVESIPLGRGLEDISRSGCRLRRYRFAGEIDLDAGTVYPVELRFRSERYVTRIRVVWVTEEHCGVRLTEAVPFWPVKF